MNVLLTIYQPEPVTLSSQPATAAAAERILVKASPSRQAKGPSVVAGEGQVGLDSPTGRGGRECDYEVESGLHRYSIPHIVHTYNKVAVPGQFIGKYFLGNAANQLKLQILWPAAIREVMADASKAPNSDKRRLFGNGWRRWSSFLGPGGLVSDGGEAPGEMNAGGTAAAAGGGMGSVQRAWVRAEVQGTAEGHEIFTAMTAGINPWDQSAMGPAARAAAEAAAAAVASDHGEHIAATGAAGDAAAAAAGMGAVAGGSSPGPLQPRSSVVIQGIQMQVVTEVQVDVNFTGNNGDNTWLEAPGREMPLHSCLVAFGGWRFFYFAKVGRE
jgi:hypothetical protein